MIFKKLILTNFKSHKDTVVNFEKGINVIIGQNGAGKSSILEGISFALFKQHTGKKIDDLVTNNTKTMKVELEFEAHGSVYKIIREKKANLKSTLFEKRENKYYEICSGDKEITQEIESILGMDADLFLNAIYVRQGEIANLINKTPAEKQQFIGKLLNINVLEKCWKSFGEYISQSKMDAAEIKGGLNDINEMEEHYKEQCIALKELKSNTEVLANKLTEYQEHLSAFEKKKEIVEQSLENYYKHKKEVEETEQQIQVLDSLYKETKKKVDKVDDIKKKIDNLEEETSVLNQLYEFQDKYNEMIDVNNQCHSYGQQIIKSNEQIDNYIEKIKPLVDIKEDISIKECIDFIKERVEKYSQKINELTEKSKEYEINMIIANQTKKDSMKSLKQIQEVGGQCPICQSDINESTKKSLIEEHETSINKAKECYKKNAALKEPIDEQINDISNQIDALNNALPQAMHYKDIFNDIQGYQVKYDKLFEKKKALDFELAKSEFYELDDINGKIKDLENKNLKIKEMHGYIQGQDEYIRNLGKVENKLKKAQEKLETVLPSLPNEPPYTQSEYDDIINEIKTIEGNYNKTQNKIAQYKGQALMLVNNITQEIYDIQKMTEKHAKYENLIKCIDNFNAIRELFSKNGVQRDLRQISKPLIEKTTKECFNEFSFNYSNLILDEDYNVILYGPEGESSMSMVSGGEKIAVALALRLGITKAISKGDLDTILLDEPTIHLDASRRDELIELVKDMSSLPQMIIVTHETQLQNVADNLIEVEKNSGISKIL